MRLRQASLFAGFIGILIEGMVISHLRLRAVRVVALSVALLSLHLAYGQTPQTRLAPFHGVHRAMGTEFTIDLYAPDQETAEEWMQLSFDEVDRIEDLLSNYRSTSELSRISREAGTHPVTTDPETFVFVQRSLDFSRRSDGAFDITVGPLMRAWGFFFKQGRIPPQSELLALKKQTGWKNIELHPATRTIFFTNRMSMELDPGGIGKGYTVDRIVGLLREQKVSAALISAGASTIYALGAPPDAKGWLIHVPDPAHDGTTLTTVALKDTSLSTSACTERFFIKNGHRYCHILDPVTMSPVEGMLQTTIISPSATDSDALSTATFVMGVSKAAALVRSYAGTSAILVSGAGENARYKAVDWPQALEIKKASQTGINAEPTRTKGN